MKTARILALTVILFLCGAGSLSAAILDPSELPSGDTEQSEALKHLQAGAEFLQRKALDDAKQAFEKALEAEPDMAMAMLGLAEVALAQGNRASARTWMGNAVRAAPEDPRILLAQARLLIMDKNYAEAERVLKKITQVEPNFLEAYTHLGDLYLNVTRDAGKAAEMYRKAVELDPNHASAHYALGMALTRMGKEQQAVSEFEKAARLMPKNVLPLIALGEHYYRKNDLDKSLQYFNKALEVSPGNPTLHLLRGLVHEKKKDLAAMVADLEQAVKGNPELTAAWIRLGMVYQAKGEKEKARNAYLHVIERDEKNWVAFNNLAWMAAESGEDLDRALRWADKARLLQPQSHAVYDTLGWVYRARKEYPKAIVSLERALKLQPNAVDSHYHLGVTLVDAGRKEEARRHLKKVIELAPGSAMAREAEKALAALH